MDWNPAGANDITIPDGAVADAIAIFPVIELLRKGGADSCETCRQDVIRLRLDPKLDSTHAVVLKPHGTPMAGTVAVPGDELQIPEGYRITGVKVFYRPHDRIAAEHGRKAAQRRRSDPGDPYEVPRWEGPIAEFALPAGRARADAELKEANARLRTDHRTYSVHPAHAGEEN